MHLLTTTPPTGWSTEGSQYALTEQITKYVREEWMSESINEPTKQGVFLLKAIEANILIRSFHHPSPWNLPLCLPKIHPSYLYSFPIAARINDHRRGDLKQRNVFSHSPWTSLKSRRGWAVRLLEAAGDPSASPLPASHDWAFIPPAVAAPPSFCLCLRVCTSSPRPFLIGAFAIGFRVPSDNPGWSPLEVINLVISAKTLFRKRSQW